MGPIDVLAQLLSFVLTKLIALTGRSGLALILLAALLQAVMYVPLRSGNRARAQMVLLQPFLEELKKKYGDDSERLQEKTMQLWQRNDVNPLGGCLPHLVWIGVIVAMWRVFGLETIPWPDAHFLWMSPGWPHDTYPDLIAGNLASFDALLFLVFGVLSALAYWRTRAPDAKGLLGLLAFGLVYRWPAGLVLYWGTFCALQILLHPKIEPKPIIPVDDP